jgi:hypothetical protein
MLRSTLRQPSRLQIENDYDKEVHNGDIGFVETIDLDLGEMKIVFDGRLRRLKALHIKCMLWFESCLF